MFPWITAFTIAFVTTVGVGAFVGARSMALVEKIWGDKAPALIWLGALAVAPVRGIVSFLASREPGMPRFWTSVAGGGGLVLGATTFIVLLW